MKIAIVDSGLGGLSICALLAQRLFDTTSHTNHANRPQTSALEIKYINAVPENDWGFNQMESRQQKIFFFDKVLSGIDKWYQPDFIFIACHTLSVLLEETIFFREKQSQGSGTRLVGMIPVGVCQIVQHLSSNPSSAVIVFAAETTIEESIYATKLKKAGIAHNRIVSQALPGLASMISNDPEGKQVLQAISIFVKKALLQMVQPGKALYAFLGCTHYGFQAKLFEKAFQALGYQVLILNPNEAASQQITTQIASQEIGRGDASAPVHSSRQIKTHEMLQKKIDPQLSIFSLEFISRYALPDSEVATLSCFLAPLSPKTVHALQNYTLKPDLF